MVFKGNLLDFQHEDVEQLKSKRARLCGNEPGTGKTYVGIALDQLNRQGDGNSKIDLTDLYSDGKGMKTLIVCPKSVLSSWDEHCMDLTEDPVYVVDVKNRHIILKQLEDRRLSGYFVVTWDFIRIERRALSKIYFFHVIADEVHKAKGRKSQQTIALKHIMCVYKTGLTGTPADNQPSDLWSIINWLWPNYYTSFNHFVDAYMQFETTDEGYKKFAGPNMQTIDILHKQMKPWFTRRRKKDVLKDLPDKYYSRLWVDLSPKQRKAYDQMKKVMIAWTEQHKDEIERQDPIIAQAVVSQLVRLQQFASAYVIPKLDEEGNYVYKRKHKRHKRGECPYTYVPLGQLTSDQTENTCRDLQQFEVTDPSSKLDALMEYLEDRPDDQVIIFSQYKSVINLLAERLGKVEIPFGLLTGDVNQQDRATAIQRFQRGDTRVFAGTIAAGGVGVTLTAASTVIFIDRVWSPSINVQAEDRAHRIGQTNAVQIIDLMARNTVDLGKAQKVALKLKWIQQMLGDDVDADAIVKEITAYNNDSQLAQFINEMSEEEE